LPGTVFNTELFKIFWPDNSQLLSITPIYTLVSRISLYDQTIQRTLSINYLLIIATEYQRQIIPRTSPTFIVGQQKSTQFLILKKKEFNLMGGKH
jgi:hypothetical protein